MSCCCCCCRSLLSCSPSDGLLLLLLLGLSSVVSFLELLLEEKLVVQEEHLVSWGSLIRQEHHHHHHHHQSLHPPVCLWEVLPFQLQQPWWVAFLATNSSSKSKENKSRNGKNSAALVKETQQLRFHSLSLSLSLSYNWICSTPKINSIAQIEKVVIQKQQEFLRLDHRDFNFLKKQTRTPTADRQTVALLQSNSSSFVPKFKAAFLSFGILPTRFTKEAPWSQKNTTQHSSIPRPQNLKIWIQKQKKVP